MAKIIEKRVRLLNDLHEAILERDAELVTKLRHELYVLGAKMPRA